MNKLAVLAGAAGLLGLLGLLHAKREDVRSVPWEIKAIQCQQDSKFLAPGGQDVFDIAGTTLAVPCQHQGSGKRMVEQWQMEEERDPAHRYNDAFKYSAYEFKKRPDGRFERTDDASSPMPFSGATRYAVQTTMSRNNPGPLRADIVGNHREMSVPTPPAFAATGAETTFWCQDPKLHPDMQHQCIARAQSNHLFWTVLINFGGPVKDDFDMRPEVIEAYQLLAAHIIKQEPVAKR